jgi:DDE superfamily endonuclease
VILAYTHLYTNLYTRPQNAKELFNLRHASLRNAIERIFGVLKRKFKILKTAPEYSIQTQVDIVLALIALFNFTRSRDGDIVDNYICTAETDIEDIQPTTLESIESTSTKAEARSMDILRDKIAEDMWKDYQQFINQ